MDRKKILEVKKYLDNGFNGKQAAYKAGVCECVSSKIKNGMYGTLPTFASDPELESEVGKLELEKMLSKLSKRKVPKNKK